MARHDSRGRWFGILLSVVLLLELAAVGGCSFNSSESEAMPKVDGTSYDQLKLSPRDRKIVDKAKVGQRH